MYNKIKVLLIAVAGVDKNRLIKNLAIKNRFQPNYKLTVGVDILTKDVEFRKGEIVTLSIWDIKDQYRFGFIRSTFYKGAVGAILVFDLTQEETYSKVRNVLTEIRRFAGETIPFILVGDNVHLLKLTDGTKIRKEAHEFAVNEGGIYIETSPTSIDIIEGAIQKLVQEIIFVEEYCSMGIPNLISKAIKTINLICREQSSAKLIIPRQYLPELFDNKMLEISEEDGLPIFKQIIELMSGISIEYSGNEVMIYNPSVNKERLIEEVNFGELKEGAEGYIVRPFSGKELLKRIKELLDKEGTD